MVKKPFNCDLCHKSFHTATAKNEHTQLRHRDKIINPADHSVGEHTDRVVINSSVNLDNKGE